MKLTLEITETNGDTYTVTTNLGVIVAWERRFKRKVSQLGDGIGGEDLAFMAYECCKQIGRTVPAVFDDYIRRVDNVEILDDEPANPTNGGLTHTL